MKKNEIMYKIKNALQSVATKKKDFVNRERRNVVTMKKRFKKGTDL